MKTIKKHIHRLLFILGFCPKEAKQILLSASREEYSIYMCPSIIGTPEFLRFLSFRVEEPSVEEARIYLGAYGFTRKNYLNYVKQNYPTLSKYLHLSNYDYWLGSNRYWKNEHVNEVIESKKGFLKYLADKL